MFPVLFGNLPEIIARLRNTDLNLGFDEVEIQVPEIFRPKMEVIEGLFDNSSAHPKAPSDIVNVAKAVITGLLDAEMVAAEEFESVNAVGLRNLASAQLKRLQWDGFSSKFPMRSA